MQGLIDDESNDISIASISLTLTRESILVFLFNNKVYLAT